MRRQTSKGTCTFCHRELSKASTTRHLESCEQRTAMQGEIGSRQKAKKIKTLHLVVEGYRLATGEENPLPASVLNASMKTKDDCVKYAQRIMYAVKSCSCHCSILR